MQVEFGPPLLDRAIADRARRQYGVIARGQLADLGLSLPAIDRRVALGRLHVVHHGVCGVGHTVLADRRAA